jgi:threonylcarbamoyladenosine tRNA methylthiotransferase CDKAL1
MKLKVYIEEGGCIRRKLDLNKIRSYLEINDYELVDRPEDADKILVGTCAFKKLEEEESIQRVKHFMKYGPKKMVVYGCFPDIARERFKEFADISKVAPREIDTIEQFFPVNTKKFSEVDDSNLMGKRRESFFKAMVRTIQTRPTLDSEYMRRLIDMVHQRFKSVFHSQPDPYYLFICRGCLGKCTYCARRRSIGSIRSKPVATVISEFQRGIKEDHRDFVVFGDDPGCYGIDQGSTLPELMKILFSAAAEVKKSENGSDTVRKEITFYLDEIHPKFLISYTEKFLTLENFSSVRSILSPFQSGSNRILELMGREHTAEQYEEVVKKIHVKQPQTLFHAHIIVGFPSETEEDFHKTLDFVVRCGINSVVVFPYGEKSGCASALLQEKIPPKIIKRRMREAFKYFKKAGIPAYYKWYWRSFK